MRGSAGTEGVGHAAGQKTSAEQVVLKRRQIEVQTTQGKSLALACKEAEISEQSCYSWRKEYSGLRGDQARKMKDLERENARLRRLVADLSLEKQVLADVTFGKCIAPERCRQAVAGIREKYGLSERHARRIVGQHRGTQRYVPTVLADEDGLTRAIVALASEYGRYGYRRVTALLQADGWRVGKDRVQRIWRSEGLNVPQRHRPRSRLWLNDGSCVRLRPLYRNHVWSFDFVQAQTHDGRSLRILTLIDEHSRACLALKVSRRINSLDVIEALADAMCLHGIPEHIRCNNGPEMISKALRKWVAKAGSQIQYIAPGSPWENGYCEIFDGKLRDECLRQEIFYSLKEAQAVIALWQNTYNCIRPHSSLGLRPPAPVSYPDLAFRLPMAAAVQ
ncbi:IS3 family transposase [Methylobacterium sp. NMS14P]|uniref:IS3 family transposase n=1 Tax=Methylobacterium sp. NMS14P TaxID=2894310 RepID=UPI00235950DF|nr:IS3 family transposase [Methylobacterium sp. NMS14P]WCS27880.1 IS3 family transposase [Methylobacterium sp. NMS14P]